MSILTFHMSSFKSSPVKEGASFFCSHLAHLVSVSPVRQSDHLYISNTCISERLVYQKCPRVMKSLATCRSITRGGGLATRGYSLTVAGKFDLGHSSMAQDRLGLYIQLGLHSHSLSKADPC